METERPLGQSPVRVHPVAHASAQDCQSPKKVHPVAHTSAQDCQSPERVHSVAHKSAQECQSPARVQSVAHASAQDCQPPARVQSEAHALAQECQSPKRARLTAEDAAENTVPTKAPNQVVQAFDEVPADWRPRLKNRCPEWDIAAAARRGNLLALAEHVDMRLDLLMDTPEAQQEASTLGRGEAVGYHGELEAFLEEMYARERADHDIFSSDIAPPASSPQPSITQLCAKFDGVEPALLTWVAAEAAALQGPRTSASPLRHFEYMMHVDRGEGQPLREEEKQLREDDAEHCLLPFIQHQQPLVTKVEDEERITEYIDTFPDGRKRVRTSELYGHSPKYESLGEFVGTYKRSLSEQKALIKENFVLTDDDRPPGLRGVVCRHTPDGWSSPADLRDRVICEEADDIMDYLEEDGLPDKGLRVPLKFGFRLNPRGRPNSTVFVPYLRSGLEHPDALIEANNKQKKDGQIRVTRYNKKRPAYFGMDGTFASRGSALKVKTSGELAYRPTFDHSLRNLQSPLSTNFGIDIERDFQPMRLPTLRPVTRNIAILGAITRMACSRAQARDPAVWDRNKMTGSFDDFSGYFNLFHIAHGDTRFQQSFGLLTDDEGAASERAAPSEEHKKAYFACMRELVMNFGSKSGPASATRFTVATVFKLMALRKRLWRRLTDLAAEGHAMATTIVLPELLEILEERRRVLGEGQDRVHDIFGYIDDLGKFQWGGLMMELFDRFIFLDTAEILAKKVAKSKQASGQRVGGLGFLYDAVNSTTKPLPHKSRRFDVLAAAARDHLKIESKWLEKLAGTASHMLEFLPEGRLFARRMMSDVRRQVRALENKGQNQGRRWRFAKSGPVVWVTPMMSRCLDKLREWVRRAAEDTPMLRHTAALSDTFQWDTQTDACRGNYSGMGGWTGQIRAGWKYRIKFDCPVHLTEMAATIINLLLLPTKKGDRILERIDNQSALFCMKKNGAKDCRLTDMQILRRHILEVKDNASYQVYIRSEENTTPDALSRWDDEDLGSEEPERFREAIRATGINPEEAVVIDLEGTKLGQQVDQLLKFLEKMNKDGSLNFEDPRAGPSDVEQTEEGDRAAVGYEYDEDRDD